MAPTAWSSTVGALPLKPRGGAGFTSISEHDHSSSMGYLSTTRMWVAKPLESRAMAHGACRSTRGSTHGYLLVIPFASLPRHGWLAQGLAMRDNKWR